MKRITKDLYKKLEELGLIDLTKDNANVYSSVRRKNKYVCEQVLIEYENINIRQLYKSGTSITQLIEMYRKTEREIKHILNIK